jgi:hypothetical protein
MEGPARPIGAFVELESAIRAAAAEIQAQRKDVIEAPA